MRRSHVIFSSPYYTWFSFFFFFNLSDFYKPFLKLIFFYRLIFVTPFWMDNLQVLIPNLYTKTSSSNLRIWTIWWNNIIEHKKKSSTVTRYLFFTSPNDNFSFSSRKWGKRKSTNGSAKTTNLLSVQCRSLGVK